MERARFSMDYISRIKQVKNEKKITNEKLSELTGIPLSTVSKILAGISDSPKLSNMVLIARALDCTLDYIVSGTPQNNDNNYTLNEKEIEFIEMYRQLDYYGKDSAGRKLMHGEAYAHKMGRVVADCVVDIWDKLVPCGSQTLKTQTDIVYTRTRTDGAERYAEAKAYCEAYKADHSAKGPMGIAEAQRIVEIREAAPIYQKIPVCTIEIGDVLIAGIGAEPFTKYGTAIRELAKDRALVMTACLMNGYECYMPHTDDFKKRDYAVTRSRFTPALFGETVDAFEKMLKR